MRTATDVPSPEYLVRLLLLFLVFPLLVNGQVESLATLEVRIRTDQDSPVPGGRVAVRSAGGKVRDGLTGPSGDVRFDDLTSGSYQVTVSASGFQELQVTVDLTKGAGQRIDAVLARSATRKDSVTVEGSVDNPVEQGLSTPVSIKAEEVKNLPDRPFSVDDALPLAPAILRLPSGLLSIGGMGEHRSTMLVNSDTATDPATGQFGATIPIDGVQTMNILTSPFLAEYGGFTSNVISVETRGGGDKWTQELNDPLPEFRFRSWHMVGLKTATPRFSFGGPLLSRRLHLLESVQYEMRSTSIITQPFPNNQQRREGFNSFTALDYVVSATNMLTATFHAANQHTRYANMDAFNPEAVTPNDSDSTCAAALTDRASFGSALLESAISANAYRAGVWPQGTLDMILTPVGNQGNYFSHQSRTASRLEWRETLSLSRDWLGVHNFKFGSTLGGAREHGQVQDHPVNLLNTAGSILETIHFTSGLPFERSEVEAAFFAQDHWVVGSHFAIESGIRSEQQSITGTIRFAPCSGSAGNGEGVLPVR